MGLGSHMLPLIARSQGEKQSYRKNEAVAQTLQDSRLVSVPLRAYYQ